MQRQNGERRRSFLCGPRSVAGGAASLAHPYATASAAQRKHELERPSDRQWSTELGDLRQLDLEEPDEPSSVDQRQNDIEQGDPRQHEVEGR